MAKLIVTDANNVRREFPLAEGLTIGRSSGNHVQLAEEKASRSHCRVHLVDGKFYLEDLKSSNGTKVNGQRITEHLLRHSDTVIIGGTTIVFDSEQPLPDSEQALPQPPSEVAAMDKAAQAADKAAPVADKAAPAADKAAPVADKAVPVMSDAARALEKTTRAAPKTASIAKTAEELEAEPQSKQNQRTSQGSYRIEEKSSFANTFFNVSALLLALTVAVVVISDTAWNKRARPTVTFRQPSAVAQAPAPQPNPQVNDVTPPPVPTANSHVEQTAAPASATAAPTSAKNEAEDFNKALAERDRALAANNVLRARAVLAEFLTAYPNGELSARARVALAAFEAAHPNGGPAANAQQELKGATAAAGPAPVAPLNDAQKALELRLSAGGLPGRDELTARLVEQITANIKAGEKLRIVVPLQNAASYGMIETANAKFLIVAVEESAIPLAWSKLTPEELAGVAKQAAKGKGEGLLLAAEFAIACGQIDSARELLDKAMLADVALVEKATSLSTHLVAIAQVPPSKPGPGPQAKAATPAKPPPPPQARVNHAGRILPQPPELKQPVLFNTPEADAVVAAMQIFPKDNPWNEDISSLPVHPDSDKIVARLGKDRHVHFNQDMNFVLVPPTQPRLPVKMRVYEGESDPGPYPVPDCTPVEGWPLEGGKLEEAQRHVDDSDRHAVVVDPWNNKIYEFYQMRKTDAGWEASNEATFDLGSNKLRPKGWTSSDAAGLPIFPSIIRYDEVERGMVEHALRFTVQHSRKEYIYPATHHAGNGNDPAVPAMGQRFRLKATADLNGLPKHALAVARGLQKYGMFVADNGANWFISSSPDPRLKGLEAIHRFKGSDFEVVQTTGEQERPQKNSPLPIANNP